MNKLLTIFILLFCTNFCYADFSDLSFHQPSLGRTELYDCDVYKDLKIELRLEHSYVKMGNFIFPCDFQGESELYDLGFYIDMDKNILNGISATNYRILYRNERMGIIPEPCSLLLLGLGGIIIFARKNEKHYRTIKNQ